MDVIEEELHRHMTRLYDTVMTDVPRDPASLREAIAEATGDIDPLHYADIQDFRLAYDPDPFWGYTRDEAERWYQWMAKPHKSGRRRL